jgi:hypothetical protein
MNTVAKKKITLMLDTDVYEALKRKVGARKIGAYISQLTRPQVVESDIEAGYRAMAVDEGYNREANEWLQGTSEPIVGENDWPASWYKK